MRCDWRFTFPGRDVGCTAVKEDNKRAIHVAKNPVTTPNSKHIDVRHHFLRERVANGEFDAVHLSSAEQNLDVLDRPLRTEPFRLHRTFVMSLW